MAINQDISVYGQQASKPVSYSIKSKGSKTYGFKFPFSNPEAGVFLKKSSDLEVIKSGIKQLLLTKRGERVMLPNFGTNLRNYIMEPLDQSTLSQIRREIVESIYKYAANVVLNKILVVPIESDMISGGSAIGIQLFCSLKEDQNVGFEVNLEIT